MSGGAGVDLVGHQVVQLEHVDLAHHDALCKGFAGAPIVDFGLAILIEVGGPIGGLLLRLMRFAQQLIDIGLGDAVKDRGGGVEAEHLAGGAEIGLEELPDVHA